MSRRLLLTALDWTRAKDPPMSLGQASIVANLHSRGCAVKHNSWSVNNPEFNTDEVVDFAMNHADESTDFAIGAFVWNENHTHNILNQLKEKKFPGRIILGGPQISYVKQDIENYYPQADIFVRGYGEEALAQLMKKDSTNKFVIPGVHYAGEPDFGYSANIDLEDLPSPMLTGYIPPQRFIRWETQRGCPFRCTFCQHRESDTSMVRRQFPEKRVMKEAQWITENPIIQDVAVLDPTFNSGPHYLDILDKLREGGYTGKLALQCRPEMVRSEFLDAVERLNETANVVLEFGLQTIHKQESKIINRGTQIKKVSSVLKETKQRNISVEVSLIFGLPQQTLESFITSIEYCKSHGVPTIMAFPLMLLRGTPLYDQREELGLVQSDEHISEEIPRQQDGISHVVASPSFSYSDWRKMVDIAEDLHQNYNKS